jgi:steroid delta-isomerase-like uncharacterized protein
MLSPPRSAYADHFRFRPEENLTSNKATHQRLLDASNFGDSDAISQVIDEAFHPDVSTGTPLPITATGTEAVKEVYRRLHDAYPDLHIAAVDVIAEGDKVVCRQKCTGTHQGEYLGVSATGKFVTWDEIFILRFVDGRIAETWGVVDMATQMKQLGVTPGERS